MEQNLDVEFKKQVTMHNYTLKNPKHLDITATKHDSLYLTQSPFTITVMLTHFEAMQELEFL